MATVTFTSFPTADDEVTVKEASVGPSTYREVSAVDSVPVKYRTSSKAIDFLQAARARRAAAISIAFLIVMADYCSA